MFYIIQNLLSLVWSERSFSGSPAVRMMTQWLAQDCCAPEGAIGLQAGWGGAGADITHPIPVIQSLFSETQPDVSEL